MNGCNEQTLIIHYVGRNYDYYICRTLRNAQCHNPLGRIHTDGNRDMVRNFGQVHGEGTWGAKVIPTISQKIDKNISN